jgi:ferric-dicitrate binding protein FerR (iron transport regulator)
MESKIERLVIQYLQGTISREDEKLLIEWIKNNPDSIKELSDFRKLWGISETAAKLTDETIETEWKLLKQKVYRLKINEKKPTSRILYWLPRFAAIFILGAVFSVLVTYLVQNSTTQKLTFYEINTPAGAKTEVTLPDGTTIWLNASSNLKYSNRFGRKNREIFLEGEALFKVAHDKSKVFVVQTADLKIKAYGTTFNVKSYSDENTVETTLIEGSIGITRTKFSKKKRDEVMLEPNQSVVYYKPTSHVEVSQTKEIAADTKLKTEHRQKLTYMISKGIDTKPFTAWKDGTLFIKSETLKQLAIKLERKYDVTIHFSDKQLEKLKFTGVLENETIEQVIDAIGIAAHIDYSIEDRDIWFNEIITK